MDRDFLEEMYRELSRQPEQTIMRNGAPCFSIPVDPSLTPEQVAAMQDYLDRLSTPQSPGNTPPEPPAQETVAEVRRVLGGKDSAEDDSVDYDD